MDALIVFVITLEGYPKTQQNCVDILKFLQAYIAPILQSYVGGRYKHQTSNLLQ